MSPVSAERLVTALVREVVARARRTRVWALPEVRWASAAAAAFALALIAQFGGGPWWVYGAFYAVYYLTGGWEPAWAGLRTLKGKALDVDLLMIVAALGAAAIGQVLDGGLLIVIFATSGALEALATQRTADSVRGLLDLTPATATRITAAGEETVDTGRLKVGEVIMTRPASGSAPTDRPSPGRARWIRRHHRRATAGRQEA
jgi:cation transport ATPase